MTLLRARKISLAVFSLCGACIGAFLAVRIRGLFAVSWNVYLPMWSLWVSTCLFALLPALYSNRLRIYFDTSFNIKALSVFIIGAISLTFCIVLRKFIIDKVLAGSGIYPSPVTYLLNVIGAALLLALFTAQLCSTIKKSAPSIRRWIKTLEKRDFMFILALIVLLNLLAWFYIHKSVKIYIWDVAGYWQITQSLAENAHQGIAHLLLLVYNSIQTLDYNYLIALPWTTLVLIFGSSRWVFICGIVNFGLVPLFVLIYAYLRSICKRPILASLCLIGSFPMLVYTTLVGYVDIIGVFFILSALLLWKADKNRNDFGRFMIIGVLLAIAILLRRWFCFFALSFVIALIVDSVFYRKSVIPFIGTLLSLGFSLLFLFQPFVSNVLLKNYTAIYSDYQMGLSFDATMFFSYFGAFTIVIAIVTGIFFCFKHEKRQMPMFLLLQIFICFVVFTSMQSHNQQHLLLYIPSLIILMSLLICPLADALTKRQAAGVLLAVNTLLPSLSTVFPAMHPRQIETAITVSLLPNFTFKPPVYKDATEIVKIIRYLDNVCGGSGKTVGVLACSFAFNYDTLMNAEASLNMNRITDINRSYLVSLPAVDSRDPFPGALFYCDYLLVADPIQLHLGEEKQQVVYVPAEMLLNHTGIGAAYEKTGEVFSINGGKTKIMLFKKIRELTETEANELINIVNTNK